MSLRAGFYAKQVIRMRCRICALPPFIRERVCRPGGPAPLDYWQGPVQTFSAIFCAGPKAFGLSTAGRRTENVSTTPVAVLFFSMICCSRKTAWPVAGLPGAPVPKTFTCRVSEPSARCSCRGTMAFSILVRADMSGLCGTTTSRSSASRGRGGCRGAIRPLAGIRRSGHRAGR